MQFVYKTCILHSTDFVICFYLLTWNKLSKKKFWTHEITTGKNFGPMKYPREKIRTHEGTMVRWHETHDGTRNTELSIFANDKLHHQRCIKSSTLRYIINDAPHYQRCILPSTLYYSVNDELHHQRCITSYTINCIINDAFYRQPCNQYVNVVRSLVVRDLCSETNSSWFLVPLCSNHPANV